jgi:hypothetical protein
MHRVIIFVFLTALTSCKEISFKQPQPKGKPALAEIPRDLIGEFLLVDDDGNRDTLIVTVKGYEIRSDSTKGTLGDSLILKKYKGYYFFNDHENPEWLLRVVKRESNGDLSYMYMDSADETFNDLLLRLNKEIHIDSSEVNGEKLYQIDPTPRELMSLIKKGFFNRALKLKKLK